MYLYICASACPPWSPFFQHPHTTLELRIHITVRDQQCHITELGFSLHFNLLFPHKYYSQISVSTAHLYLLKLGLKLLQKKKTRHLKQNILFWKYFLNLRLNSDVLQQWKSLLEVEAIPFFIHVLLACYSKHFSKQGIQCLCSDLELIKRLIS